MTICNKIWQIGKWPTPWTQSLVITLSKKGNLQQCQNYRTISLISNPSKIMLEIILNRCPRGLTFSWWGCYGLCLRHKPTCSVLVSVSVFKALSTVFYSINSPNNSPLSYAVFSVLFLPYWSFQLYISLSSLLQPYRILYG